MVVAALLVPSYTTTGEARAARPPVVVIVFDEFPTTSLFGKNRRLDAVRYPNFAAFARRATWFRNATTVHDSTLAATPSILDGRLHHHVEGTHPPAPRRGLPALLARHGYRVHARVEARGICAPRWCGHPRVTRYYLNRNRITRLGRFIRSIRRTRRPTLYLQHTLLPHVPWTYLPSGRQYLKGPGPPLEGLDKAKNSRDPTLVRLAWAQHLLQVGAVDRALGNLISRLRATGLWERALVVLVADHGISFRVGEEDRRAVTAANLAGIAPVPLFVKAPRQRRGRISRSYVRTVDVLPTIAKLLRIRVPWRMSGRSAYSRRSRGAIRVGTRITGNSAVTKGTRAFQAQWGAVIHRQHALFGFGGRGPGVYGGPHAELLGRRFARVRSRFVLGRAVVTRRGRVRAVVLHRRDLRRVRARGRFRPALIAGRIVGGARGARRDLVVTVNGRVGGVGRSFHLRTARGESFAVLVPDWLLRPGRNRVRVLSVARRRGRLSLRLLGGA